MKRSCPDRGRPTNLHADDIDLDRIVLRRSCGATLSVHRFLGRWAILRVTETPDDGMLPRRHAGFDGVTINVVTEPDALDGHADTVLDLAGSFARSFPGLHWPATFVIDPSGRLVAILTDDSYDSLVQALVRTGRTTPSGAVDLGDINT